MAIEQLSFDIFVIDPDAARLIAAQKIRRCLSCNGDFRSHGPGNRVCDPCKSAETWRSGYAQLATAAGF